MLRIILLVRFGRVGALSQLLFSASLVMCSYLFDFFRLHIAFYTFVQRCRPRLSQAVRYIHMLLPYLCFVLCVYARVYATL